MAKLSCSCCCSVCKVTTLWVLGVGIVLYFLNPILDNWICPLPNDVKNQTTMMTNATLNESTLDIYNYSGFGFMKEESESMELDLGPEFILHQSFPRWFVHLVANKPNTTTTNNTTQSYQPKTINVTNARNLLQEDDDDEKKQLDLFQKMGFTMVQLPSSSEKKEINFRTQDIQEFHNQLRPILMKRLFPNASRIEFTYNVIRGGHVFGDQPAAVNAPHLDYSQNDTARREFHEIYPPMPQVKEQHALLGHLDTDNETVGALIGIWKPILMEGQPVCDHPLAIMDASTFRPQYERLHFIHINFILALFHNLNGGIVHDENQRWYYYPYQTQDEVLIFTQYTRGRHFATPHGALENSPFCKDYPRSRISVEMRAAVFFPKEKETKDDMKDEKESASLGENEELAVKMA